jgi:hypothetical protein
MHDSIDLASTEIKELDRGESHCQLSCMKSRVEIEKEEPGGVEDAHFTATAEEKGGNDHSNGVLIFMERCYAAMGPIGRKTMK